MRPASVKQVMMQPGKRVSRRLLATGIFGLLWMVAVAAGLATLINYETAPGTVGQIHSAWPSATRIPKPKDRAALIMLAHPRCPCTQASISELAKIMAHVQGKLSAYVLFLTPHAAPSDWENAELPREAAKIPGVTVVSDIDGVEARKFGAETSGHTFLYDRNGTLLFNGGITQSRGHAGDNAGENSIVALVNDHHSAVSRTFVFGCSLVDKAQKTNRTRCLD
jgi:hypothetical protein